MPPLCVRSGANHAFSPGDEPASASCLCVWLTGAGDQRAWQAGFTAVSRRCDPAYLPSQGPRNQLTHARKGEAVRHRGGYACGDREPMPVCMPVAPWRASISGGLVMLAERR